MATIEEIEKLKEGDKVIVRGIEKIFCYLIPLTFPIKDRVICYTNKLIERFEAKDIKMKRPQ